MKKFAAVVAIMIAFVFTFGALSAAVAADVKEFKGVVEAKDGKFFLKVGDKTYEVQGADLKDQVGKEATVKGTLEGNVIKVAK
jgi:hypothetical protein